LEHSKENVYTLPYSDGISRLNNKRPYNAFTQVVRMLEKKYEIDCLIMYTTMGTMDFNLKIINFCKQKKIKVVYDFCDYFEDISKNQILKYIIKSRDLWLLKNWVIKKCDGVITISSYLQKMVNRFEKTVIIPPLAVECNTKNSYNLGDDTKILFSYASFVTDKSRPVSEWKDRIDAIIDIFVNVKMKYGFKNFELQFIGLEEENLLDMFLPVHREEYKKKISSLKENLCFTGTKSNKEVQNILLRSDYTILLRDSKTSTNAGFPTKVSESIALGIPVVVNITSDIGEYIKDGYNGVVLSTPINIEEDSLKIKDLLEKGKEKSYEMKANAKMNNPFYYTHYADIICDFLNRI
jgi:glycosyltransferase involved in cell wall biosynthesis